MTKEQLHAHLDYHALWILAFDAAGRPVTAEQIKRALAGDVNAWLSGRVNIVQLKSGRPARFYLKMEEAK
jgi:hypothetical protein